MHSLRNRIAATTKVPAQWIQIAIILAVFVLGTGTYLLARLGAPPVFDDTFVSLQWNDPGQLPVAQICPALADATLAAFGQTHESGYRPLSLLVSRYFGCRVANGTIPYPNWIAVVALIWGATATAFFWLALRITADSWVSTAVTVLFMATPPFVAASWVTWAGIQPIVPLLLCLGMGLYANELERRQSTWRTWVLAAIFLVGPWFREFTGVLAIVILATEIVKWGQGNRDRRLLAWLAALGAMHAVFPTALARISGFQDLPIVAVSEMGYLGARVSAGRFMYEAAEVALLLLPPLFMLFVALATYITRAPADTHNWRWFKGLRLAVSLGAVALLAAYYHLSEPMFQWFATALVALIPAVFALTRHLWLALWYTASFLPFLRVYTQETHLAYLAAPLALIAGVALQDLLARAKGANLRWVGLGILAAAIVGVLDQAINIPATRQVMARLSESTGRVAQFLQQHVDPGATVVVNGAIGFDIALFSRNHVNVYFSNGHLPPDRLVLTLAQFVEFVARSRRDVYLLSIDAPDKLPYHRHKFVALRPLEIQPVARIDTAIVEHSIFDPLRLLFETRRVSFLGPPDLVNDIYSGPSQLGQKLSREHYVAYSLYKVSTSTALRSPHTAIGVPSLDSLEVGLLKTISVAKILKERSALTPQSTYRGYVRACDAAGCYAVNTGYRDIANAVYAALRTEPSRWAVAENEEKLVRMIDTLESSPDPSGLPWLKPR